MRGQGSPSDDTNLTIMDQVMPDKGDKPVTEARFRCRDCGEAGEATSAAVRAAHTAVAHNINLELERAVVRGQQSVSVVSAISVTADSKSGTYSALPITGQQFLKKYVNQQSKQ